MWGKYFNIELQFLLQAKIFFFFFCDRAHVAQAGQKMAEVQDDLQLWILSYLQSAGITGWCVTIHLQSAGDWTQVLSMC